MGENFPKSLMNDSDLTYSGAKKPPPLHMARDGGFFIRLFFGLDEPFLAAKLLHIVGFVKQLFHIGHGL